MALPSLRWSWATVGERPGLLVGRERALLHYTSTLGREPVTKLVAFDFEGRHLWSRTGWAGLLSLPGERFLVNTPAGEPLVISGSGEVLHRWRSGGITTAARHGDLLMLADARHVWAGDLGLNWLWQVTWPGPRPEIDCFADGAFYWARGDEIKFCARGGGPGRLPGFPRASSPAPSIDTSERQALPASCLAASSSGGYRLMNAGISSS